AALRRVAFRAQVLERLFELAPHIARDPVAHRFLRLQLKRHVTTPVWTAGREDCSHARTERHTPATAKRIRKMTAVVRDFLQVKAFLVKPPGPTTYSEWNRTTERSSATFVAGRLSDGSSLRARTLCAQESARPDDVIRRIKAPAYA